MWVRHGRVLLTWVISSVCSPKIDHGYADDNEPDAHDLDEGHAVAKENDADDRHGGRSDPRPDRVHDANLQVFQRLDHCQEAQQVEDHHERRWPESTESIRHLHGGGSGHFQGDGQ